MALHKQILDFWFGEPGTAEYGTSREIWFKADADFDAEIQRLFREDLERAGAGAHDAMVETPEGALALIILMDQFSRNIFRGTPRAFEFDPKALAIARGSVDTGHDQAVEAFKRGFLYLPFEHSEALADQDRSVALFTGLGDEVMLDYAIRHRDVIQRFGRFPHRNAILGRESTPEELAFLEQPGSSF
jgi:uncharacterized protein (DUF924 family)